MNKAIALVFVVVAAASCAGLAGCGSARGGETAAPPAEGEETSPGEEETGPGVVDMKWGDIPVYAMTEQTQKGSWAIPPAEGDWSRVEWRYYRMSEMAGTVEEAGRFYKNEMPKNGWQETMWLDMEGMTMSYYTKNGERDGAAVWIGSEEDYTVFALMRASQ